MVGEVSKGQSGSIGGKSAWDKRGQTGTNGDKLGQTGTNGDKWG
jgi:hypothetical protein